MSVEISFPIHRIAHKKNINFTGRDREILRLRRLLGNGQTTAITQAITGLGGVGKTQLALEYCYYYKDKYELIFWLRADAEETLVEDMLALGQLVGVLTEQTIEEQAAVQEVLTWLRNSERLWLLLFDNADLIEPKTLRQYLPEGGRERGHIVITSRNRALRAFAEVVELDNFEPDFAVSFIARRSGQKDETGFEELANELEYFPLALEHAAAYMETTRSSATAYLDLYKTQRQALFSNVEVPDTYHATLMTTWEVSFVEVQKIRGAMELLNVCSFLASEAIPLDLLINNAEVFANTDLQSVLENKLVLNTAISALLSYSLVERQGEVLTMHRMVQMVIRERLGVELRQQWLQIALELLAAASNFGQYNTGTLEKSGRLLPHLLAVFRLANQSKFGLEQASVIHRLETQIAEQNRLSQFSQALNFTIEMDVLLELIYMNFQRLLGIEDIFIVLRDLNSGRLYKLFHIEDDERIFEEEGRDKFVADPNIERVMSTKERLVKKDKNGRTWLAAPLNAGADTIGVIYTFFRDPEVGIPERQQYLFSIFADQAATSLERMETNRRLQDRAQQLEIINKLTFSLRTITEEEVLLELILDKAMELFNTEAGTLMIVVPDTGELEFKVVRRPASENLVGTRLPLGTGLAGTAAQTFQAVIVNVDENSGYDSESILTVPLIRKNTALGVLQVINKRNGGRFTEEDKRLLLTFVEEAVVALENVRLLKQTNLALQNKVYELSMLQQLDRDLNATLDLTHILNLILDRTLAICKSQAGSIILLDPDKQPYRIITREYESSFDPDNIVIELSLINKVINEEQPFINGDVRFERGYVAANSKIKSQMILPLISKQSLLGIITIESYEKDAYSLQDLDTAVRVINHAAVAMTNAMLYEQINEGKLANAMFVSMVSHELRTPMTSMRGYTDLLLSGMTGALNDQQRNFLETIAANIQRMGEQIQSLIDFSRIEAGRLHISPEPTFIIDVMNQALHTVTPLYAERNVRLHLQLPDDLPMVYVDENRLIQVMINLLSNACKYSPSDTDVYIVFEETVYQQADSINSKKMILCSVADSGYGISQSDQNKLFTKFFRSEDPNIRQVKGTGLGLAITKGIIEFQGGEIWVESEIGKGTTITFTIPLSPNQ